MSRPDVARPRGLQSRLFALPVSPEPSPLFDDRAREDNTAAFYWLVSDEQHALLLGRSGSQARMAQSTLHSIRVCRRIQGQNYHHWFIGNRPALHCRYNNDLNGAH